ncbi:MAG: 50S ribosomal protein L18e [Nanoarchaeota archaeon]
MKSTIEKNIQLAGLIAELKKLSSQNNCMLWKRIASDLEKSTRNRRVVNVYKIDQHAAENETVIVPGKVLGVGELSKKVSVAAYTFSEEAFRKIQQKGEALTIPELMQKNPKAKNVKILG